eukprot:1729685-Pleurochrysis_carterae.AAC.1
MVLNNFERCLKAGEYLLELAEFGHRLTVGFGWSPHDGSGLTYRFSFSSSTPSTSLGAACKAQSERHTSNTLSRATGTP